MQKPITFIKLWHVCVLLSLVLINSACNSSRMAKTADTQTILLAQAEQPEASSPAEAVAAETELLSASADYMDADSQPAAAATQNRMIVAAPVTSQIAEQAVYTQKNTSPGKLKTAAAKVLLKTVVKKAEKAQKKFDIKKEKAAKAGKAMDPDIRTGILIGALGLILIIIAAAIASNLVYTLGGIALTIGLVVIILAALDVI